MRLRFAVVILLIVSVLFIANTNVAQAGWNSINSGYAVTTDWHGEEVPIGTTVKATAGTTNDNVYKIEIYWYDQNQALMHISVIYPQWGTVYGTYCKYANATYTPDTVGDWTVQAIFRAPGGHIRGADEDIVAIRASSFFEVPEVPFGTIAIVLGMIGALGVSRLRTKKETL